MRLFLLLAAFGVLYGATLNSNRMFVLTNF